MEEIDDKFKKILDSKKYILPKLPEIKLPDLSNIQRPLDINIEPKFPDLSTNINDIEFDFEDNILFQIEQNQQEELIKLKELNDKKDAEILELKINAKKERRRFWWTYSVTTMVAIVGIILGIIF